MADWRRQRPACRMPSRSFRVIGFSGDSTGTRGGGWRGTCSTGIWSGGRLRGSPSLTGGSGKAGNAEPPE